MHKATLFCRQTCVFRQVHRQNGGFTLIELLLAVTIGAVLLSAVYMSFSTAIDSQRRIDRVTGQTQAQRFFTERLRSDLKNLSIQRDSFVGTEDSLSLQLILPDQKTHEVSYHFNAKKTGSAAKGQIRRQVLAGEDEEESKNEETVVFEEVEKLAFRYLVDGDWQDTIEGEQFPRALECTVSGIDWQRQITIGIEVEYVPEQT